MDFLVGKKQDFFDFVGSIKETDRVGIITHNDLDGIASGLLLEKILNSKGIEVLEIGFASHKSGMLDRFNKEFKEAGINKLFFTDVNADEGDFEGFLKSRELFDVFMIDHHPVNEKLEDRKNIIKGRDTDCAALIVYELGKKYLDFSEWDWLVSSAIVGDWSFKDKENMQFLKERYPEINEGNIFETEPGKNCELIDFSLVYYDGNLRKVFDLVKEKKLDELKASHAEVREELERCIKKFKEEREFIEEKNMYYCYFPIKFKELVSSFTTITSKEEPDKTFVFISDAHEGFLKVSARNQNKTDNMNALLRRGIEGLPESSGGGHIAASGASFRKEDLNRFKQNLLK